MTQYSGPFDVRVFSNDFEFRPSNGVVCVEVAQDAATARELIDRYTRKGYFAAAYHPETGYLVKLR